MVEGIKVVGPEYVAPIAVFLATDEAKNITGQFIFSSAGDIRIFARPFQEPEAHYRAHKDGKWTVDELIAIMPKIVRPR
jgi:hypothetical protein